MHSSKSHDDRHAIEESARSPDAVVRDVPAIVGANLRRLRKAQGHSLERLAELSGVSRAMLGQIETGKSVPTVSLLWKVADALKSSYEELWEATGLERVHGRKHVEPALQRRERHDAMRKKVSAEPEAEAPVERRADSRQS